MIASLSTHFASTSSKFLTTIDDSIWIRNQAYFGNIFNSIFLMFRSWQRVTAIAIILIYVARCFRVMLHDGDDISAGFLLSSNAIIERSTSDLLSLVTIHEMVLLYIIIEVGWPLL